MPYGVPKPSSGVGGWGGQPPRRAGGVGKTLEQLERGPQAESVRGRHP